MTSLSLQKCLFCYKSVCSADRDGRERISKFLKGFQRHKQTNFPSVGDELLLEGSSMDSLRVELCSSCSEVVESFNEFHTELEILQLQLAWVMDTIANTIKFANHVPARFAQFRSELQTNLEENYGTPSDAIIDQITAFRHKIERKCHQILTYPRVVLNQLDPSTISKEPPNQLNLTSETASIKPEILSSQLEDAEIEELPEFYLETDNNGLLNDPLEPDDTDNPLEDEGEITPVNNSYPCRKCRHPNNSFKSRYRHETTCVGVKPYQCHCLKSFDQEASLKRHRRNCPVSPVSVETPIMSTKYPCSKKCGRFYSSSSARCRHERSCGGSKPWKCLCRMAYTQSCSLKRHQATCPSVIRLNLASLM